MPGENQKSHPTLLRRLLRDLLHVPWLEILIELWKVGQKLLRGLAEEGMYEVLDYHFTLELLDPRGRRAHAYKHEKVRYLQNHIIAYQDEAWGDGKILIDYRCSPGIPVDYYRPGKKTYILISLRGVKNRGDVDEFNSDWKIRNGFLRSTELWDAEINHRMKKFKLQVIFPKSRPPRRVLLVEETARRTRMLEKDTQIHLPDGRWSVAWETKRPRLHETYSLKWEW